MYINLPAAFIVLLVALITIISFIGPQHTAIAQTSINTTQAFSIETTATPVKEADATVSSNFVLTKDFSDPDNNCEFCTRMVYTPGSKDEAGLAYSDAKLDLGDTQRLVFFAKAENPSEQVSFVAAGNDTSISATNDTDIFSKIDFAVATENVTLTNKWERFQIGLNDTNLNDAKYPFGIQFAGDSGQKQTFYLKGVTLDSRPAQDPLPTVTDSLNETSLANTTTLTANIDANSTNSPAASTIEFGGNATGGSAPYSYSWNFGDGNNNNSTYLGPKVPHTFAKAGNYTITLAAKDSSNPPQNASANIVVTITSPMTGTVAEGLVATIDANSTKSPAPATIEFGANATGGLAPYSYNWNFGDGSNASNSTYVGLKVLHTFDRAGNYTITLAAKDSGTPSQNASANVVVTIGADVNKTVAQTETVTEALTATIDANSTNSPVPATIEFAGNATGGLAPYSYNWNFGDGNNSTYFGSKVPHAFDKAGNYIITLAAKDSGTPSQTASANVVVTIGTDVNKTVAQTETVAEALTATIDANSTSGLGANGTNNNSSQFDILAANVTTFSDPAKVESGTNSTSMIGQHTEPKLQLQKPPEFPRTAEKNITFVSKNADKSNSTNHMPHADDQSVIIDGNKATNIVLKGIDQDNDKIKFDIVSEPLMGVLAGFDKNSGTVMYVPNPGSDGTDRFTFRAVDIHNLQSNVAEVLVIVNAIQDTGHKLADVNAATSSNEPVIITVKASNHVDVEVILII